MIALRARTSLDRLLEHALRQALETADHPAVGIEPCDRFEPGAASRLVLLMIASHGFRMVLAIGFPDTPRIRDFMAALGRMPDGPAPDSAFGDAVAETGNMCCGALNRELGRFYPHTGMSTPHLVDAGSAPHLAGLRQAYGRNMRIDIGQAGWLHAALAVDAHEPMDFDWVAEVEPQSAGELELF
ncbi:hypothetical protein GN316_08635 [Xylophilus sp. Kf1]|nr:hypothetical protein [Xylophilus sp. Kf1]